jgi:hypothetical protein
MVSRCDLIQTGTEGLLSDGRGTFAVDVTEACAGAEAGRSYSACIWPLVALGSFVCVRVIRLAMVGQLITLPLRLGVRSTQVALRATEAMVWRAASIANQAVRVLVPARARSGAAPSDTPETAARSHASEERASVASPTRRVEALATPASAQPGGAPSAVEPQLHVSEQPVVVSELAEPGAEDGAGADVSVAEPWEGYAGMTAKQVIARLEGATPAELAAVSLYESAHKGRQTVLAAVERELKTTTGRARQTRKEQTNA